MSNLKGYFAVGAVGVDKPRNVGALFRTAHAFGASFVFTIAAEHEDDPETQDVMAGLERDVGLNARDIRSADTSDAPGALPYYAFGTAADWVRPAGCQIVGVEIDPKAIDLPAFRHPRRAAYLVGSERRGLGAAMIEQCDHLVRIPTAFSINLATAAAIVLYDRMICLGRFAERPVRVGGPTAPPKEHRYGAPILRRERR